MKILITGGLGFVGRHTVNELLSRGHTVHTFDIAENTTRFTRKNRTHNALKIIRGDIRYRQDVIRALRNNYDVIIHLAARVGVGESMYRISDYVSDNTYGTAVLLEEILNWSTHTGRKLTRFVVASSMSVYGEGNRYIRSDSPLPITEDWRANPESIYAMTKYHQEQMSLLFGKTYGPPVTALRFFNIYGPGQSMKNPYTGVVSIFLDQMLNGESPTIFDDGLQTRDFIHVKDIAKAVATAAENQTLWRSCVFNVGTGIPTTILDLATKLKNLTGFDGKIIASGVHRKGDIRHCISNISAITQVLRWSPEISLEDGLKDVVKWAKNNTDGIANHGRVIREAERYGLLDK